MKFVSVSLLLVLLTACKEDPLAPVSRLPREPTQDVPVVITGRLVGASNGGIAGANLRVIEAGASVGSDETGHYRIVLPARFRGQIVPVNVRAIGFKALTRTVRLVGDTVALDVAMAAATLRFDCELVVVTEAHGTFREPGFSVNLSPATKVKRVVRAAR